MDEKICAVIVTYNRKNLLIDCLEALESQSYPLNSIYVIDNASTYKTSHLLLEKGYIKKIPDENIKNWEEYFIKGNIIINYIRMPENTGGAGGFYEGIKKSYEKSYDWIWLMDDDGKPAHDCLEKLLEKKHESFYIAPIVISNENKEKLAFLPYINVNKKNFVLKKVSEAHKISVNEVIQNFANPFNGILINKALIEKIGFPRKEFFLKGDEYEYFLRTQKFGFKIITFLEARFYHPPVKL